ncbi:MAG: sugar ABC transporter permease [Gemmatimonadota bacterium]|nr:sugar ABC transporter permease [Gemmatimonadota bacterium]
MTRAHRHAALAVALLWGVASAGVAWRTLRAVDHAARSQEALAAARQSKGRVPVPAWPAGLNARAAAAVRGEETPLVVRGTVGTLVTAPVKDADDWDIIGAVAMPARAGERLVGVLFPVALGVLVVAAAVLAGARWRAWTERRITAVQATASAAAVLWVTGRIAAAATALAPAATPPADAARLALAPPSLGFATLLLSLLATGGLLAQWGIRWHAANAERPARVRETVGAWAFIAPSLAHLVVFTIAPVGFLLWISVHDWDLLASDRPFVGLAHFRELGADSLFWRALRNGLVYALYVPATMVAALGTALVLDQPLRGIKILRVVVFLPYVASTVAIALVWQWLLHRDFGLLNAALVAMHLPRIDWLGNPATALPALMLVSAWGQLGYMMVVYLAGLQAIPASLLEAARLDGANAWQRFRLVVWPMLRPVSTYLLLTGIIWSFHGFTLVYVMTEGGPAHATDVLVYRIYQTAWEFRRFDVAAAMSVVLCGLLLALTALQWRVVKGEPADA